MKILKLFPPNFKEIKAAFPAVTGQQGILYAWGDRIYNPSKTPVPEWLIAHEAVHHAQQASFMASGNRSLDEAVRRWWEWYIRDAPFRLNQEVPAHRVEYATYLEYKSDNKGRYLDGIAKRLSGPLYGSLITEQRAREKILAGVR